MSQLNTASYTFHHGTNLHAYEYLGANLIYNDGEYLYTFRTFAKRADAVTLAFRNKDKLGVHKMARVTDGGVFECTVRSRASLEGVAYRFEITVGDRVLYKADPYARRMMNTSDGWSAICCESSFRFSDEKWIEKRKSIYKPKRGKPLATPINVYEVHLGSFARHPDGRYLSYREIADALCSYVKFMGYTHVELMPLAEYPYDASWGYQCCGFYAPSSRFGSPDDLKYLVNRLHNNGIGVILDWVGAHFPKDDFGLIEYDGYPLYEYADDVRRESRNWGTRYFDLRREEVQSFLLSNALYYLREFHFDGLRVDAVASMIYLDFDRSEGEWTPNHLGTNIDYDGVSFLQKLTSAAAKEFPSVLLIAEESASFGKITHPVSSGGLGFTLKWNMGFANDFFEYMSCDPIYRKYNHKALTFPLMYAFSERFVLPISHDEVVHGKRSFIDKMFGSYEDKFRQMRAALLLIATYPGKKLTFMGTEYAQFREWDYDSSLEWFMLDFKNHRDMRAYVAALNRFYLSANELWELDFTQDGFEWVLVDECDKNTVVYKRRDIAGRELIVLINLSGVSQTVEIPLEYEDVGCVFDTDGVRNVKDFLTVSKSDGGFLCEARLNGFSGIVIKQISKNKTKLKEKRDVL